MLLNAGVRGSGREGSPIAIFYNVWVSFYNERVLKLAAEFDVLKAFSFYDRIGDASNQNMEDGNHDLNDTHSITAQNGKKTILTWLEGCRLMEKQHIGSIYNLGESVKPKKA